jgi:glycosyltransferase involved in cell wall biosynthesis
LPNTQITLSIHKYLEKLVLNNSDLVITVSNFLKEDFLHRGAKKAEAILNGFDDEDFNIIKPDFSSKFTLIHAGSLEIERNPVILWDVLVSISKEIPEFKDDLIINLTGKIDNLIIDQLNIAGLGKNLNVSTHRPHEEIIPDLYKSHILLLPIPESIGSDKGIMPGKMYEYMRVGGSILAFGPLDGDAAKLITKTQTGKMFDFKDFEGVKDFIIKNYLLFKDKKYKRNDISPFITSISRQEIANHLSIHMTKLIIKDE